MLFVECEPYHTNAHADANSSQRLMLVWIQLVASPVDEDGLFQMVRLDSG
jgi:hypothetical protein